MCPESNWLLLSVVSLGDSHPELLVWALLKPSPGSMLYDQLLVLFVETDVLSVLSNHNSPSNPLVLEVVLILVGGPGGGLEEPLLVLKVLLPLLLLELLHDLLVDLNLN